MQRYPLVRYGTSTWAYVRVTFPQALVDTLLTSEAGEDDGGLSFHAGKPRQGEPDAGHAAAAGEGVEGDGGEVGKVSELKRWRSL